MSVGPCDWCGGNFELVREGDADLCSMCSAPPPAQAPRYDTTLILERLSEIDAKFLEPLIKKAADNFYCQVLDTVDDYLIENLDHNMSSHIRMLERENAEMRTQLWDVDRALGCLSMGHETRLSTIRENQQRFNQASAECWRLREALAEQRKGLGELKDMIGTEKPE
jgi:hypothetical protein